MSEKINETLYEIMDWGGIEAIVYSEEDHPEKLLGAHLIDQGVLIQAFFPGAEKACVLTGKEEKEPIPMEKVDETGFFAVLLEGKKSIPSYRYEVTEADGRVFVWSDPYSFEPIFDPTCGTRFTAGICYDIYQTLGAHPMTVGDTAGIYFSVWAPNAVRVSLVGDFNSWDGRALPMRRIDEYGIFELFVPGLTVGTIYKYEIKAKGGLTYLKADPFANAAEVSPGTASMVTSLEGFEWTDSQWMEQRQEKDPKRSPVNIYEVHLGTFRQGEGGRTLSYRELAPVLARYVREMGYTHVELMPVMEYPSEESMGYQTTGYYAPTSRYGSPADFMFFINYMHDQGIGVILDYVCSQFPRDLHGLIGFDGTCLFEHQDPRQGVHPVWNTLLYNYGRPQVRNFLIAGALFWLEVFHADGLRLNDVSSILYLDYGKSDGQWVANMYGGNENLDGAEFLKHLNSIIHKRCGNVLMIAEESRGWPQVTAPPEEGGLGFDLKWNEGYTQDLFGYMQLDPIFRGHHHNELTFSMIYYYSEDFLLSLSHDEIMYGKGSFLSRMPGKLAGKQMNLKAMLGYTMMHPGKKLLFMGQEWFPEDTWNPSKPLSWDQADDETHKKMHEYVKQLNHLYRSQKALFEKDYKPDGFEWINEISANENMLVFLRKGEKENDTLLIVINFSALVYENHKIGVPFPGKFKEIFNSDRSEFGGSDNINPRLKNSRYDECDGRPYSIRVTVPPMGISVFTCTRGDHVLSQNEKSKAQERAKKKKPAVKKDPSSQKRSLKEELAGKVAQEEPSAIV